MIQLLKKTLVRLKIRDILSLGFKLVFKKNYHHFVTSHDCWELKSPNHKNVFWGYYDITPFHPKDNNWILAHANNVKANTAPHCKVKTDIICKRSKDSNIEIIDSTYAWNWQQGSRLQWLDSNRIIYNVYEEGKLFAKTYDFATKIDTSYATNVSIILDRDKFISLDYSKLTKFSEYGYNGIDYSQSLNGIFINDIKSNLTEEIFTLKDAVSKLTKQEQDLIQNAHINHLLLSPQQKSMVFILRGKIDNKRVDYLFKYSFKTKTIELLISNALISHYAWKNEESLVLWGRVNQIGGYYEVIIDNYQATISIKFKTNQDGHPSMIDNNRILTDTYPNRYSNQELYIYDFKTESRKGILLSYHPVFYNKESRCDLHPSLSADASLFQIDTRFSGNRSIIIGNTNA